MDVGVRELKARLSAYLDRAAGGEMITVTVRGRPIAVLGPPLGRVDLDDAIEAGWVTRAVAPGRGLRPVRRSRAHGTVGAALDEDRGE